MWKYQTVGIMGPPVPHVSTFIRKFTVVPYLKVPVSTGSFD